MNSPECHEFSKGENKFRFHIRSLKVHEVSNPDTIITEPENQPKNVSFKEEPVLLSSLILTLTDACNLRCRYCFERSFSSQQKKRVLTLDVAKKALDLYLSLPHNPESFINLFGGEPMLWWENIPPLVQYGNEKAKAFNTRFLWGISTNGTYVPDDAIRFFVNNHIVPMINIDGDQKTHDSLRPFANGEGSYDTILANYRVFRKEEHSSVILRATVTPDHPHLFHVFQLFSDLHPDEIALFPEYFQSGSTGWDEPALRILLDEYSKLAEYVLSQILGGTYQRSLPLPFSVFFHHLCAGEQKKGYCGAYGQMIAVAPDGLLYPCMLLDGYRSHCIGDISGGLDHAAHDQWKKMCQVENRVGCKDCWARYICGGGCIGHTVAMYGQQNPPAEFECRIIRHLVELSIWMYHEILKKRPGYFVYLLPGMQLLH